MLIISGLLAAGAAAPSALACNDYRFPSSSYVGGQLQLVGNGFVLSTPWTERRGRMDQGRYLSAISYSFSYAPDVYEVVDIPGGSRSSRYFTTAHPNYYRGQGQDIDVRVRNKASQSQTLQPRVCL